MIGKRHFLQRITSQTRFKSLEINSTEFEGSSPPSVFIGAENYPKVYAGPMLSQEMESQSYDSPERWLSDFKRDEIINFRLNLLRCKQKICVTDVSGRFAQKMQEIALAGHSVYSHAEFDNLPRGVSFSEEHAPFGPSAQLRSIETESPKWQKELERAYNDTDLHARDAVAELHKKGIEFTKIQKALSVGAFGNLKNRKMVPTKWSITATDDMLGKNTISDVKENDVIKDYRVYESAGMDNYFAVLMTPEVWQYEAIEAFINLLDSRTFMFSDYENYFGRKAYSDMGGCYYAQRFAIAEKLRENNEQAGAFVFREAYEGYIPTGVWLCRELTKNALNNEPKNFGNLSEALHYIDSRVRLGVPNLMSNMQLIHQVGKQKSLNAFI